MHIDNEWLEEILRKDATEKNVVKVADWKTESAVGKGENFTGSINRVMMDVILGNGKKVQMSVIVKRITTTGAQAGFFAAESFFDTEIKMYNEILPFLEDVLKEQGIPALWPALLGKRGDYLIFSDLQSKNYRINNRHERLDLEHCFLAMRTLAIFHTATIVLKQRGQLDVSGLNYSFALRSSREIRRLIVGGVRLAAKTILDHWGPEWKDIGQRIYKRSLTLGEEIDKFKVVDESRLNVLCHGDLWTTNIMFKYSKGVDSPIGVRFIDFQLSHYNSYAYDLIYFLTCGMPANLRRTSTDLILETYTNALTNSLKSYGYGHLAPTMKMVKDELKRLTLYSFANLLSIMPMVTAHVDPMDYDLLTSDNDDDISQNPEAYLGNFKDEVSVELLEWAKDGLF